MNIPFFFRSILESEAVSASPLPFIGVFPSFPADASSPLGRGIGGRRPLILVPYALEPAWPHPFSEVDDSLAADSFGRLYLCTFYHLPFVPAGFSIFLGISSSASLLAVVYVCSSWRCGITLLDPPACNKAQILLGRLIDSLGGRSFSFLPWLINHEWLFFSSCCVLYRCGDCAALSCRLFWFFLGPASHCSRSPFLSG